MIRFRPRLPVPALWRADRALTALASTRSNLGALAITGSTLVAVAITGSSLVAQALNPVAQAAPKGFTEAWSNLERSFHGLLTEEDVVGGSIAFVRGADLLALTTHGFADRDSGAEVDGQTIYHWASITKTLTSIAILQLRDRGRLDLDDPIVDYVPELGAAHNPFGPMEQVTLRHLLSHSAGFRGASWPWAGRRGSRTSPPSGRSSLP